MTAAGEIDLIGSRIQAEVERAIQRNIKGLEYFSSPAPVPGATPKDLLHTRGTLNLYHYRPLAAELYRVPLLLVMATTNRGYIFDLAPGQSLVGGRRGRSHLPEARREPDAASHRSRGSRWGA